MNIKYFLTVILLIVISCYVSGQNPGYAFSARVSISEDLRESFDENGRLYIFFSQSQRVEPRTQTWPGPWNKTYIFARNISGFDASQVLEVVHSEDWVHTSGWTMNEFPDETYYVQFLWDQDTLESRTDAQGNLYSKKIKVDFNRDIKVDVVMDQRIGPREIVEDDLVKLVEIQSDALSTWWNKAVYLKASVLLPHNYDENTSYPIRYNVAGYGGRYTRINRMMQSKEFRTWWTSGEAPQIITVFLDGEGPFGDSYQLDSENNGPYGYALVHELIPYIESKYRGNQDPETRFVDGCSTGGWVSLALQLYYPEVFNGCFSYSPDAIDFENYQLVNIYEDKNAYYNEYNYLRPIMRDTHGEPMLSMKEFIQYENVLGASNTYLNSGGQISAHTALYSPKGDNGLPAPLIDPETGDIDREVAEHWKKYDLKLYAEENWPALGPKLEGKIYIWMGDMDHFYLNTGTRGFASFIESAENPVSDAEIVFSPTEGHCSQYSHKEVLLKIEQRLEQIKQP